MGPLSCATKLTSISYGARQPEKTRLLCQKLGGPKDPSPKRPALGKTSFKVLKRNKSGGEMRSKADSGNRRTLERILTDDRSGHRRQTPSLSRSATEPVLPQLKREVSEVALSTIPKHQTTATKRYSHREVDIRVTSQTTEAKVKKKAQIESELQVAIAALKKPNARVAVKEFVEAADQRIGERRAKKPLHPRRIPFATHVTATPSKDKQQRDGSRRGLPQQTASVETFAERVPPSSIDRIPDSTTKVPRPGTIFSGRSMAVSMAACAIQQTPSKSIARSSGRAMHLQGLSDTVMTPSHRPHFSERRISEPRVVQSSPKLPAYPAMLREMSANVSITRSTDGSRASMATAHAIQATPIKKQKVLNFTGNSLTVTLPSGPVQDPPMDGNDDDDCDEVDLL